MSRTVLIPLIVGLVSFAVFYMLGWWTGNKLRQAIKPPCQHQWSVLLEKYPTFTQDRWQCSVCRLVKNFPHGLPPVKTDLELCNMGYVHIVTAAPEWDEWPDRIS